MFDYTPVPAPLTGNVELPQDAIDDVVVGTVNPAFQQLADGVAFNTLAQTARFSFDNVTTAHNTIMPISLEGSYPSGSWGIASNLVTVPYVGVYQVTGKALAAVNSGTDNLIGTIYVQIGSAEVGVLNGIRPGTSTGQNTVLAGTTTFAISDPATQKIKFMNQSGFDITVSGTDGYLHPIIITYLGKY